MTSGKIGKTSNALRVSFPAHSAPGDKFPELNNPPLQGEQCISLSSGPQFPASFWNYSNKPIALPHGNQGMLCSLAPIKPVPRAPGLFILSPEATTMWPSPSHLPCPMHLVESEDPLAQRHCLCSPRLGVSLCSNSAHASIT